MKQVKIKVDGKLAFVKGIKEGLHLRLKEAKDLADELVPYDKVGREVIIDLSKHNISATTFENICDIANAYNRENVSYTWL